VIPGSLPSLVAGFVGPVLASDSGCGSVLRSGCCPLSSPEPGGPATRKTGPHLQSACGGFHARARARAREPGRPLLAGGTHGGPHLASGVSDPQAEGVLLAQALATPPLTDIAAGAERGHRRGPAQAAPQVRVGAGFDDAQLGAGRLQRRAAQSDGRHGRRGLCWSPPAATTPGRRSLPRCASSATTSLAVDTQTPRTRRPRPRQVGQAPVCPRAAGPTAAVTGAV
jgi:hypothetical protein